jgi:hypothetical protein
MARLGSALGTSPKRAPCVCVRAARELSIRFIVSVQFSAELLVVHGFVVSVQLAADLDGHVAAAPVRGHRRTRSTSARCGS